MPWRLRPGFSGGGLFVDLGSHTLDLLDWPLSPVAHSTGMAANQGGRYAAEDLVGGVFEITGTAGTLSFSSFGQEPLRLVGAAGAQLIDAPYPPVGLAAAHPDRGGHVDRAGRVPEHGRECRTHRPRDRHPLTGYRARATLSA